VCVRVCNSPEAQSKRAWPEIQSKGIIYRQESWRAIWTPSSSTEGNKTLHSPSLDCTASHPDPKSNREKNIYRAVKKRCVFRQITLSLPWTEVWVPPGTRLGCPVYPTYKRALPLCVSSAPGTTWPTPH